MPKKDKMYLVLANIALLGGQSITAVDAFSAEDAVMANNLAQNLFLHEKSGATMYGDHAFLVDSICNISTTVLGVLDPAAEENIKWVHSVRIFEEFLAKESKKATEVIEKTLFNDEKSKD